MKHSFLILFFSLIQFISLGQVIYKSENINSSYIFSFKEKIDSIIENRENGFLLDHADGDWSSITDYYFNDSLIKDKIVDIYIGGNGFFETVTYYNLENNDCLSILKYFEMGSVIFEFHLIKLGPDIFEEPIKGDMENFLSNIERSKKALLNAP